MKWKIFFFENECFYIIKCNLCYWIFKENFKNFTNDKYYNDEQRNECAFVKILLSKWKYKEMLIHISGTDVEKIPII